MARAIGIDLGTTYSLAAWVDDKNRPRLVTAEAGGPLLPSAVLYGPEGAVEVGGAARRRAVERPEDAVLSVKRLMGRGPSDLGPADRGVYRYQEEGSSVRLLVDGGRRAVTPVEVSAEILRALKARAAEALGEPPGGCVITVPAWFDDAQRQATRDAGRLAGLEVLRLLPEPTAAALAYGLDQRLRGTFAVYDLGGGTFDVSVLRLEDGVFQVLALGGDTHLGGDDLDRALAERLLARAGLPLAGLPPAGWRSALELSRRVREQLSAEEAAEVDEALPGAGRLRTRLTRAELEEAIAPVVERTVAPCRRALADAGVAAADLDGVVLVGGTTRTPLVRRRVRELFGKRPLADLDPDAVVALGAALQADALERGGRDDLLLLDVTPLSLGVELLGGGVERLIPRNSTLPAVATQEFTTAADGQTGLVVHVVQGERELARDCRSLARFTLAGLPPLPAGLARIELTYAVDADGILSVSARELRTGLAQSIQVRATYGLSEAEVEAMLVEALEHADRDVEARLLAEWRVDGQRMAAALATALAEDGALLPAGEREEIELRVRGLAEACRGDDPLAIQAWADSLDAAARGFSERRMDAHVARVVKGRKVEELE